MATSWYIANEGNTWELMMKRAEILLCTVIGTLAFTGTVMADPIEGTWKRPSTGVLVEYAASGDQFCGLVLTGEFTGQSIGCLAGKDGTYSGEVIDLAAGKTYKGKATITGDKLKLSGCVLLFCKGEDWERQQ